MSCLKCHQYYLSALVGVPGKWIIASIVTNILIFSTSNDICAAVVVNSLSYTLDANGQTYHMPNLGPVNNEHVEAIRTDLSNYLISLSASGTDPGGYDGSYLAFGKGQASFQIRNIGNETFGRLIAQNSYLAWTRDSTHSVANNADAEMTLTFSVVGHPVHFLYGFGAIDASMSFLVGRNSFSLTQNGNPVALQLLDRYTYNPKVDFPSFPYSNYFTSHPSWGTYFYDAILQPGAEYTLVSHTSTVDLPLIYGTTWQSSGVAVFGFTSTVPEVSSISCVGAIGSIVIGLISCRRRGTAFPE